MTTKNWIIRMKAINAYLPTLGIHTGEVLYTKVKLVHNIARNIPSGWKAMFKLAGGYTSTTVNAVAKLLNFIENEEKRTAQS